MGLGDDTTQVILGLLFFMFWCCYLSIGWISLEFPSAGRKQSREPRQTSRWVANWWNFNFKPTKYICRASYCVLESGRCRAHLPIHHRRYLPSVPSGLDQNELSSFIRCPSPAGGLSISVCSAWASCSLSLPSPLMEVLFFLCSGQRKQIKTKIIKIWNK